MSAYVFSLTHGGTTTTYDPIELANNEDAWEEATKTMGEMLKDIDGSLRQGGDMKMVVTDGSNKPLFTLRVSSVVHSEDAFP